MTKQIVKKPEEIQFVDVCLNCGSESIDLEFWGSGFVPALKEGDKWVPADTASTYMDDINYGDAICTECGTYIRQ